MSPRAGGPAIPGLEDLVPVGRGGFGTVYRAHQPDMSREVAVKFIASPGTPEEAIRRWRREVSAMGLLSNHPNILPVYAGGVTEDGAPYLVMPFVPDGSLGDRLRSAGPLPPEEVVSLGRKLAGALATAHEAGVLHRDLKPDNVLLSPYGEPQLSDFGISRLVDATATLTGSVQASLPYAPPEVLTGGAATPAADVYGLGATLFACLTGSPPFPARPDESLVAHVGRIASEDPPDLRAAGVPGPLAEVVGRSLAKDPGARYATADALRQALAEVPLGPPPAADEGVDDGRDEPTVAFAPVDRADDDMTGVAPPPPATTVAPRQAPPSEPVRPVGARPAAPAVPAGAGGGSRRAAVVVGALVLAVLVGAIALVLLDGGDPGDEAADGATATTEEQADGTDGEAAGDPEGDADPEADVDPEPTPGTASTVVPGTTAPDADEETTTTVVPPADTEAALAGAAERYAGALAAGDLGSAYDLLSPGLQEAQPRSAFEAFWGGAGDVEVVGEPRVDEAARTVIVPLTIGGQREDFALRFVAGEDGTWLVDGPRPR